MRIRLTRPVMFAAVIIAMAFIMASCSKERRNFPIATNVTAIGSISGNTFTDDNGTAYDIVRKVEDVELEDMDRALVVFNVLDKVEDGRYNIELMFLYRPLCKDAIKIEDADEETLAMDPILINEGWISGGYVNLRFIVSNIMGSETKHLVNLVMEEKHMDDTLRFTLRHNGFGEGFANEDNRNAYAESAGFACFHIEDMVPEGAAQIPVKITAPWYETIGDDIRTGHTVEMATRGIFRR